MLYWMFMVISMFNFAVVLLGIGQSSLTDRRNLLSTECSSQRTVLPEPEAWCTGGETWKDVPLPYVQFLHHEKIEAVVGSLALLLLLLRLRRPRQPHRHCNRREVTSTQDLSKTITTTSSSSSSSSSSLLLLL